MELVAHGFAVLGQFAVLIFSAAGWGYWVARLGGCRGPARVEDVVLCGLAGLCAGWVGLQDLVYADVRLAYSAWIAAAIALAGVAGLVRAVWRRPRPAQPGPASGALSLLALVFAFQAWGLVYQGIDHYYGYGRQDQVNYVQTAEFLIEKPFSTPLDAVGLHPWLVKAIDAKDQRIGEAVANGYAAVLSRTDAQAAYGAVSVFFVALAAVAVLALLRGLGAGRRLAWWGGLWAGVLPALTQVHLDGFFSQASTFFVLPALALAVIVGARNLRLALVGSVLLLTFLFSAYSELFLIGWIFFVVLGAAARPIPLARRAALLLAGTALPLLLVAQYSLRGLRFIRDQYSAASDPDHLREWEPHAGTWRGWAENFFAAPQSHPGLVLAGALLGVGLLGVMLAGIGLARSRSRRMGLAAFALTPAGILVVLLVRHPFAPYPFGKLSACFAPLAVALCVLGFARLSRAGRRPSLALALTAVLVALAAWSSLTKLQVVVHNGLGLRSVAFASARARYRELAAHPERRYLLVETHYIINAWLCYYGRDAEIYTPLNQIGDRVMPADVFAFRRPPPDDGRPLWILSVWDIKPAPIKGHPPGGA